MNNVVLMGRLTKDPELRYVGEKNTALANFSLAIPRGYKKDDKVDYINIEAWGRQAEIIYEFLKKGRKIVVEGEIRRDSYVSSTGEKKYPTYVNCRSFNFADSKIKNNDSTNKYYDSKSLFDDTEQESSILDFEELPF